VHLTSTLGWFTGSRLTLLYILFLTFAASLSARAPNRKNAPTQLHTDYTIALWPDGAIPGAVGTSGIDTPVLTVVVPDGKPNGAAMIIGPGGANVDLFWHQEGMAVAERLNSWGVTAFILAYRLSPRYREPDARLKDGQRAVQVVRANAGKWKLDPQRIGMMGFSAGAGVTRAVCLAGWEGDPNSADPISRVRAMPDFAALVYGAGGGRNNAAAPDPATFKHFPPTFIIAAYADFTAVGSAQTFLDLRNAGVSAELHLYQKGRHGFGTAEGVPILDDWMGRMENWMKQAGYLREVN
jgi:acetyl esterase/lipase